MVIVIEVFSSKAGGEILLVTVNGDCEIAMFEIMIKIKSITFFIVLKLKKGWFNQPSKFIISLVQLCIYNFLDHLNPK